MASYTSTATDAAPGGGWLSFVTGTSPGLVQFESILEKTCSEMLPAGTNPSLPDSLQLSDLIRSSSITPPAAWRAFRKKITHANPNVVILSLKVLDVCIKNSGDGFLREVGGKGGADEFEGIITAQTTHHDVRSLILSLFQTWALAFKAKPGLSSTELVNTYHRLIGEGVQFPPKDSTATGALIDSMSAPEWRDSDLCTRCRTPFTFTNRKHHCRNCGDIFDQQCSSHSMELPHFGITEKVRVCDGCWRKLGGGRRASISSSNPSNFTPTVLSRPLSMHVSRSSITGPSLSHSATSVRVSRRQQEQDDLRRAIEESLKESGNSTRAGYIPSSSYPGDRWSNRNEPPTDFVSGDGVDDAQFMAAIKASLEDMERPKPSAPSMAPDLPTTSFIYQSMPSPDLDMSERDALLTFSQIVESSKLSGRNIQDALHRALPNGGDLYQKSMNARPKLAMGIEDADKKWQILMEMNNKLTDAVREYDRILQEQITRNSLPISSPSALPQNQQQHQPPSIVQSYPYSQTQGPRSFSHQESYLQGMDGHSQQIHIPQVTGPHPTEYHIRTAETQEQHQALWAKSNLPMSQPPPDRPTHPIVTNFSAERHFQDQSQSYSNGSQSAAIPTSPVTGTYPGSPTEQRLYTVEYQQNRTKLAYQPPQASPAPHVLPIASPSVHNVPSTVVSAVPATQSLIQQLPRAPTFPSDVKSQLDNLPSIPSEILSQPIVKEEAPLIEF